MPKFKHFLLLRYNLALYSDNPYKVSNPNEWMEKRLPMYERLLKSLQNQTCKDFSLVLSFDSDTPTTYINDVIFHTRKHGIKDFIICYKQPSEVIKEMFYHSDWLITTRIDNDDEYYPNFIETIQKNFSEKEEVLDVYGLQSDGKNMYTSGRATANSPFISLVERWNKEPRTVLCRPHSLMNAEYPARFVGDKPLYIQHVHDHNAANKIIGKKL